MRVPKILACALVVGIASVASAGASIIKGVVLASDGMPLPGVTVTLEKCGAAPKTAFTLDKGSYSFENLEPGIYSVRFSLLGFTEVKQEDIRVVNDQVVELSMTLKEAVCIDCCIDCHNGAAPLIDFYSSGVRHDFDQDQLRHIPSNRDPWSFLDQTPGIDMGSGEDKRIR